jgi:hypothetical protein
VPRPTNCAQLRSCRDERELYGGRVIGRSRTGRGSQQAGELVELRREFGSKTCGSALLAGTNLSSQLSLLGAVRDGRELFSLVAVFR